MKLDTLLDGEPIGRMRSLALDGSIDVDILPEKREFVQAAIKAGVRIEVQIPSTPAGAPTGPPRYKLTTTTPAKARQTQRDRIIACLREGPATTGEVAAATGLPVKHACAYLRALWQRGTLVREGPRRYGNTRSAYLYSLPGGAA